MKYAWIQQHSDCFAVDLMCQVLQASKSAYYAWKKRTPGPRQLRTERIRKDVQQEPNQKWVTDITYLPLVNGFVYLAVVLGLFGRKVVGWELSDSLATPFGIRAMVTFGLTLSF